MIDTELIETLKALLKESDEAGEDPTKFWYWQGWRDAVNAIGERIGGPEWHKE